MKAIKRQAYGLSFFINQIFQDKGDEKALEEKTSYSYFDISKYDLSTAPPYAMEDIHDIVKEFASHINNNPFQSEVEVLIEQYTILNSRRLPAKEWLISIIREISKKEEGKRCVQYMIGLIRNRMTHGWGASRSLEETLLINKVNKILGNTSVEFKEYIYEMMGTYGAARLAFALNDINLEEAFLDKLKVELDNQVS